MSSANFDELFARAKAVSQEQREKEKREREVKIQKEHEKVTKAVLDAIAKGQTSCIVKERFLSEETLKAVGKHCKVVEAYEGVNPSTHDHFHVGYKFSW